jgi:hypothetical protein
VDASNVEVVGSNRKQLLEPIRFGEFLREKNAITDEQLLDALADHWQHGGLLGATIARRGFLSVDEVERLADEYHLLQVVEVDLPLGAAPRDAS